MSSNGPGPFHPAAFIDLVNVKITVNASACPQKTMKSSDLITHFGLAAWTWARRGGLAGHPVSPKQADIADLSGLNSSMKFLACLAVTDHQAHSDFHVLLF